MNSANGSEAPEDKKATKLEHDELRDFVKQKFAEVMEDLRYIKAAVDYLIKALEADEETDDGE